MKSFLKLDEATERFFSLYWNEQSIGSSAPCWSTWNLYGKPVEADMGGCYAIYEKSKLLYVGVALTEGKNASRTGKKYGLLNRLERHVLRKSARGSTQYVPLAHKEQWQKISCIRLIGFPDELRHLAAALECYLISNLVTVVNAQSRWRAGAQPLLQADVFGAD